MHPNLRRATLSALLFTSFVPASAQSPFAVFANVDNSGAQVGGNVFLPVDLSSNGRFAAFIVDAQLVAQDTNFGADAYVRDVDAGVTLYVGPNNGAVANSAAATVAISGTGRYVVWMTLATNLGPSDTNGKYDIYRKDMQTGIVTLVSAGASGTGANNHSSNAVVSDSGRFVVYRTTATDLAPGVSGLNAELVVTDLTTGVSQLVSASSAGVASNNDNNYVDISADGRYVSFYSRSSTLVTPDTNGAGGDIFRKDLQTGQLVRASENASGQQAAFSGHFSEFSSISADGRFVAFASTGGLVAADTNGVSDVYVKDLATGAISLASVSVGGTAAGATYPSLSADGRHVSFSSTSNQLVAGTSNPWAEIYIRDLTLGLTARACLSPANGEPNQRTEFSALSGNGRRIAMISYASNIVLPDNSPGAPDVIVRDRGAPAAPTVYCIAAQNSLGCTPSVTFSGTPSASLASGFTLTASQLLNQKSGMLFYSVTGANNTPFGGGWLCVAPPLRRTPAVSTNGSPFGVNDCSGFLSRDFNTWIQTGGDPLLVAGREIWAQLYSRDPGFPPPNNVNLTEAINFLVLP